MKNILFCSFLLLVLFTGCTKKYHSDPEFYIQGIVDLNITSSTRHPFLNLYTQYKTGEQERVTLSVESLPQGMSYSIEEPSGWPPFVSTLTFHDDNTTPGTYPVKIVADGELTGKKYYTCYITVNDFANCATDFAGNFDVYSPSISGNFYKDYITMMPGAKNRIVLHNVENTGGVLYGDVDCTTQTIEFPKQIVNGAEFYAFGIYTNSGSTVNSISIQGYKYVTPTQVLVVDMHLNR